VNDLALGRDEDNRGAVTGKRKQWILILRQATLVRGVWWAEDFSVKARAGG
jgi:hypothetical protein